MPYYLKLIDIYVLKILHALFFFMEMNGGSFLCDIWISKGALKSENLNNDMGGIEGGVDWTLK